ncbi:malic enzyme-like NAD(P)-binding protein [Haliangium sp. UPWRP_2]|uniref:NAD-dependent malic enzyme n=1 Tax=Haliangium sp. UPWRP_2 TaxID=1931276 RepID=UPI000B5468AE|nr:malic enzyme-like NAD(P)-binding protein [Haliangium sp. UPWRP_2]PSM31932.1 NAD-dependent malic enzyme [Haliangium sp. UPWRP_2]HNN92171.1 malic enzyme-like NAD(P)-binding protein [Pseudomonadota bacterium]
MGRQRIDTVLRVRTRHRPGQLARLATVIAQEGALIGEITTVHMAEGLSTRDITVETENEEHTGRLISALQHTDGCEVLEVKDRVFELHRGGKIRAASRIELKRLVDLRYIYTPGVARVSRAIAADPERAWDYTNIGCSVGIFTNGSRVLGLGNIGPLASMPVMEGKAVLYDKFAGISATPILIDTLDADEFIETVVRLSKTFGGIHLEDIRIPECFKIENELRRRLAKPVMHDDQHGTAVVTLAALINACRVTGLDLHHCKVAQVGLGAAGSAIARLIIAYGAQSVMVTDVNPEMIARLVADGAQAATLDSIMATADVVICTTGKVGLIKPEMIRKGQVIFALSNPQAEIDPDTAREAGASYAADGAAINNALAFPGIFKGALETRASTLHPRMFIAAAEAIASVVPPDEVVPSPLDPEVHEAVRRAVADCARSLNLVNTAKL